VRRRLLFIKETFFSLLGDDAREFSRTHASDPRRWVQVNAVATERTPEQVLLDLVVRDKAETLVANTLSLDSFFIIIAITHRDLTFLEKMHARQVARRAPWAACNADSNPLIMTLILVCDKFQVEMWYVTPNGPEIHTEREHQLRSSQIL